MRSVPDPKVYTGRLQQLLDLCGGTIAYVATQED